METVNNSLEQIRNAKEVHYLHRRFVFPQYDLLIVQPEGQGLSMATVQEYFTAAGLPEEKLSEVYLTRPTDNGIEFSGRFKNNGKQALADLLEKTIVFETGGPGVDFWAPTPDTDPIVSPRIVTTQ